MNRQFLKSHDPALDALLDAPADRPVCLLHSGRDHPRWGFGSRMASPTTVFRFTADGRSALLGPDAGPDIAFTGRPFRDLRTLLNHPDLPGPWVGYIAYDLARLIEPAKLAPPETSAWPLIELAHCPNPQPFPSPGAQPCVASAEQGEPRGYPPEQPATLTSNFTRPDYEAAVARALEYIAAGDVFQVNLAQRFSTEYLGSPRELFAKLAAISPAWYGAYLELGIPDFGSRIDEPRRALLSTSPELFLKLERGHVTTRPIKGTRPNPQSAIRNPQSDPHYAELLNSEKDTAELHMIVDLMRNDLGRVCRYGSVQVTEPRTIESHPTVHHGVATIEGDLHESRDVVDLLRATLPGGSVTGAPKVRAMQIIDELEPHPRGPYCGAIGLISKNTLHLNIAIRTILLEQSPPSPGVQPCVASAEQGEPRGYPPDHPPDHPPDRWRASFSVGGGIVADSDPAAEYDETLTKATAMSHALSR